jgi:hypothetical protein
VAALNKRLVAAERKRCQSRRSFLFSASLRLIMMGQPWVRVVGRIVGVACQQAPCTVAVKS